MMLEFNDEFAGPTDYAWMYRTLRLQIVPAYEPQSGSQWKRPALKDWVEFRHMLASEAVFLRWYDPVTGEHRRRRQMGAVMGAASDGKFSLDLDKKQGAAEAWFSALCVVHNNGMEPETWTQRTGGGGRQLFFQAPDGWSPPTFKTAIGVDVRGQGGFAMLPPSMHESGQAYAWEPGLAPWECELPEAPDWLIEAIEAVHEEHGGSPGGGERAPSDGSVLNEFGLQVDDREHKLQQAVWGAVVDLYRESPIQPAQAAQEAEIQRLWGHYERTTKTRLADAESNTAGLEREGRGLSELRRKWAYAMKRWDTKVKQAAPVSRPFDPERDTWGVHIYEKIRQVNGAASDTGTPPTDDITIIDSFAGDPPERPWLVEDWIAEGVVNSLYGGGGSGKSLLAMMLGSAMATSQRWLGLPTRPGRVLGVFCEDDVDELHRRMWAIRAATGAVIGYPFGEFKLACRVGHENRVAVVDRTGNVGMGPFFQPLKATVETLNPALLILDTLADVYGANEIAREQVNWFLKTLLTGLIVSQRERGQSLTVLLLGHPSAAGALEGGKGYSGSGAWEAAVRSRLYLQKPDDGAPDERILTRGKANYASAGQETALRLGWADGVFVANGAASEDPTVELRGWADQILPLIGDAWKLNGPYTLQKGHRRNVYVALPKKLGVTGHERALVQQAIHVLIDEERIGNTKRGGRSGLDVNPL